MIVVRRHVGIVLGRIAVRCSCTTGARRCRRTIELDARVNEGSNEKRKDDHGRREIAATRLKGFRKQALLLFGKFLAPPELKFEREKNISHASQDRHELT